MVSLWRPMTRHTKPLANPGPLPMLCTVSKPKDEDAVISCWYIPCMIPLREGGWLPSWLGLAPVACPVSSLFGGFL